MRISYFWLNNKKYPMSFSLGASKDLTEQYGSAEAVQKIIKDKKTPDGQKIVVLCELIAIMTKQGCDYFNILGKTAYDKAPVDESGIFVAPTAQEVLTLAGPKDIDGMKKAMFECLEAGQEKHVHTKPVSKKKKGRR